MGYFVLDPYVIPDLFPLDGADIRVWKIVESKLNLCANFTGGKDPTNAFRLVQYSTISLLLKYKKYFISIIRLHQVL